MKNKIKAEEICIVIPVHNRIVYTVGCIKSLFKQTVKGFQIVVIDDGSTDNTSDIILKTFPDVALLEGDGNLWWSGAVNLGVKYAMQNDFKYIILFNNDTEAMPDYIERMIFWAEQNPTALFSSMAFDIETGEPFYAGTKINWGRGNEESLINKITKEEFNGLIKLEHLPGRGLWVPVKVFEKIESFDAMNFPQRAADYDFTIRANHFGFPLFCNCDAKLYSYTKEITGSDYTCKFSFKNYYKHLNAINGGANIVFRWRFTIKYCPRRYLLQNMFIKLIDAFVSYPASFIVPKVAKLLRKNDK